MYLAEHVRKEYFDEFNPAFKFLVSQFSSLLPQPECYVIDSDTKEVKLSDKLFSDIMDNQPDSVQKIEEFKTHLLLKLNKDQSVRNERRLSTTDTPRRRTLSNSTKRTAEDKSSSNKLSKIARPSIS